MSAGLGHAGSAGRGKGRCHVSGTWVASVPEELGDYFGGEAFCVLGLVEERREEERFRARSGNLAKLPDAVGGRAGEDGLLAALVRQGARDRP